MPLRILRPHDISSICRGGRELLLALRSASPYLCVRPSRPCDLALAALLSIANDRRVSILASRDDVEQVRRLAPSASIHTVHGDCSNSLRPFARWAVENEVGTLVLGNTRLDRAIAALTTIDAGKAESFVGGRSADIEMLPEGVLRFVSPLEAFDEATVDATVAALDPAVAAAGRSEVQRAEREIGSGVSVEAVLRHGQRRMEIVESLCNESTDLIRSSILEASHWGYIVVRRSTLASRYHDGCAGRLSVVHAVARMTLHVSGLAAQLTLDDEQVARLTADLLAVDESGRLKALPKGRTAAGMVVRPATGRFAKRLSQVDSRNAARRSTRRMSMHEALQSENKYTDVEDDLMIFTREPDHEWAGLVSKRLRGNWGSKPVQTNSGGRGVYWDNRFVMAAAPVTQLEKGQPTVTPRDVMLAALQEPDEDIRSELTQSELYVRQIRRTDWEGVTSSVSRVRRLQIPFECIRALPAVFQKKPGESVPGHLVASPHLGLSARADLFFTAVRMPRFRCLPTDIEPGFSEEHFQSPGSGSSEDQGRSEPDRNTTQTA